MIYSLLFLQANITVESFSTVLISTAVSMGLVEVVKRYTATRSFVTTMLALGLAVVVSIISLIGVDVIGGTPIDVDRVSYYATQVFFVSQATYVAIKALLSTGGSPKDE